MSRYLSGSPEEINIARAALILDRPREQIDRYIRRLRLIEPAGVGGRGGAFVLTLDDLIVLEATARLDKLGVPSTLLTSGMRSLRNRITQEARWRGWVVFRPDGAFLRDENVDLGEIASGATVEHVDAAERRAYLSQLLARVPQTARRGRPSLKSQWVDERLAASDELGPEDVDPEEAASLAPPATYPWTKNSRSQS